jgi:hypothetical protein
MLGATAVSAGLLSSPVRAQGEPTLGTVLERATAYVTGFRREFATIVAEERYVQNLRTTFTGSVMSGSQAQAVTHRELKSDVLMVRLAGEEGYAEFRDVYEVDGRPIRNRQERLAQLFLNPSASTNEQFERILTASAQYNIGNVLRNINTPTVPLMFLEANVKPRFQFERVTGKSPVSTLAVEKTRMSDDIWVVEYKETRKGTLIRRPWGGGDLPSKGRLWIEPATGRVLMTELVLDDPIVRTCIDVVYADDAGLEMLVPARMKERYEAGRDRTITEGDATYGRFRRFGVQTDENVDNPSQADADADAEKRANPLTPPR